MPPENNSTRDASKFVTDLTSAVGRFVAVLPEIPRDSEAKIKMITEGARLNRALKLLFEEPLNADPLRDHLALLTKATDRLNKMVAELETDTLLGVATIPPFDDVVIFNRLQEMPTEDVLRLLEWLITPTDLLAPHHKLTLYRSLTDLGVTLGIGDIGIVGWIKLILLAILVILLIVSIFKPELRQAVTAAILVLAAIDGIAPETEPGTPPSEGTGPSTQDGGSSKPCGPRKVSAGPMFGPWFNTQGLAARAALDKARRYAAMQCHGNCATGTCHYVEEESALVGDFEERDRSTADHVEAIEYRIKASSSGSCECGSGSTGGSTGALGLCNVACRCNGPNCSGPGPHCSNRGSERNGCAAADGHCTRRKGHLGQHHCGHGHYFDRGHF